MITTAARVQAQIIAAGVPITGIAIGKIDQRATWKVEPAALQAAAQPTINAYTEPTAQQLADESASQETNRKELRAVALALWECIPNPTMTRPQLAARIVAIYKTL